MGKIDNEVKGVLDGFCEILDSLSNQVELDAPSPSGNGNMTLLELFYEDMRDYLLYLSCADGFITNEEATFLEDYLEYYMTPEQMKTIIVQEEIFSVEFEESEQMILKILVDMQNQCGRLGKNFDLFSPLREIYKMLGGRFLECDAPMNSDETIAIAKYLDMVNQYAADNLDDFDDIEEERLAKRQNSGVRAPKKID